MTIAVKICGITDAEALAAAREVGADWAGFVFFRRSPRYLTPEAARDLAASGPHPPLVGLFVDPGPDEIERVLDAVPLSALQVYGREIEAPALLKDRFGLPVWRAIGVATRGELPARADGADRLVIEAKPPKGATRPGGNAVSFDWTILAGWRAPAPWILAGGLTSGNVALAILASGASAVDVSSGVETAPGVKDPGLIRAFVAAARGAGAA